MKGNETQSKNPDNFGKSMGSGIRSVFSAGGRTYFLLEHKMNSGKHKAGDKQEIIVDYIELGRDPKCQVRFDEKFTTVSRRHAAITKDGDDWVIKNLSESNPTLINGQPVKKQWYLQNGDEIQLSYEGPKLGFLIPSNPSVKSIGLSHRLSLFGQQALRPYKRAIAMIVVFFVIALTVLGILLYKENKIAIKTKSDLDSTQKKLANYQKISEKERLAQADTLKKLRENQELMQKQMQDMKRAISKPKGPITGNKVPVDMQASLNIFYPDVYFIYVDKVELEYGGETDTLKDYKWNGTGFLLSDKRFITSRHNVEPWSFFRDDNDLEKKLNRYANNGGKVTAYFIAISSTNKIIRFKSSDFVFDRSEDSSKIENDDGGTKFMYTRATRNALNDWTYINQSQAGIIQPDAVLSGNLKTNDALHLLGFPVGIGGTNPGKMNQPIYGNCVVAFDNLKNGFISVNNFAFLNGNSGGPVFVKNKDGKFVVVGIVSDQLFEGGNFLIPISALR